MAKRNVWTVPHPDGGSGNKLEGSSRFLNRAPTKREAQVAGRERARRDKVEHIIQNKGGQIGQRNSYGHDPRNVPGQSAPSAAASIGPAPNSDARSEGRMSGSTRARTLRE